MVSAARGDGFQDKALEVAEREQRTLLGGSLRRTSAVRIATASRAEAVHRRSYGTPPTEGVRKQRQGLVSHTRCQ